MCRTPHTNKFQNPLRQNYKHVKTLQSLLGLTDEQIHSLVVFTGDSKFKTKMPENVTSWGRHIKYIKSKTVPVLSLKEADRIVEKIQSGRLEPSTATRREHVQNVRKAVKNQKEVT
ncbi:MAG: nuclease-related domain-containing protein [Desulfobacterales bacterium]